LTEALTLVIAAGPGALAEGLGGAVTGGLGKLFEEMAK